MFVGKKDQFHMPPLVGRIASPLSFVPKIPVDTLADPLNPKGLQKRPKWCVSNGRALQSQLDPTPSGKSP